MNIPPFTLPPVQWLSQLAQRLPAPPAWLQEEGRARLVLFLNHVLSQETVATERLARQQGKVLQLSWGSQVLWWRITPAGLLAVVSPMTQADLQLRVLAETPAVLVGELVDGRRPSVDIQGDVQLAADVAWLVDHVRWDIEEDAARWLGDAPAHVLMGGLQSMGMALRQAVQRFGRAAA